MYLKRLFSQKPERVRLAFKLLGIVILIAGFSFAVSIWRSQDRVDRASGPGGTNDLGAVYQEPLSPDDSARYGYEVERYYGKSGLLLDKGTRWLQGLMHGKGLAKTIGVVSLILAGGCFFAAAGYHPEYAQQKDKKECGQH